jgi:hypothetical protein
MIDKTTLGVNAEPEEVEAVLHNLCGYHLMEPDPLVRYMVLTREQVLYDALVASIKRERGRALADMATAGHTLTQIAHSTNLGTRQRVQRLIAMAKAAEEAALAVQAASREFHERLAAVEATLDEVVSGIIPAVVDPLPIEAEALAALTVDESEAAELLADGEYGLDELDPDAMLEPTMAMPALRPLMQPTKEMPPSEENPPWWRRRNGPGAA